MARPDGDAKDTDDTLLREFGARVRSLRLALGLNQDVFADELGMHRSYIGQLENGRKDVRLSTVARVAAACGLAAHQLLDPAFDLRGVRLRPPRRS